MNSRLLLIVWVVYGVSISVVEANDRPPNVIVFVADDLGFGDIRLHNTNPDHYRYTPNIDKLFTQGIELSNYNTHTVCTPTRAGLFTGRHYAEISQGPRTGSTLSNKIPNFMRNFQELGYRTGAFGKWHNGLPNFSSDGNSAVVNWNEVKRYNEQKQDFTVDLTNGIFDKYKSYEWGSGVNSYGFDRYVGFYDGGGDHFDHYSKWHHELSWFVDTEYRPDEKGYRTDLLTQHAINFITENQNNPFLCYMPHEAVHTPVQLKQSDLREFCDKLDSELGIPNQWDSLRDITSPTTGKRIEEVQELRFDRKEEFDYHSMGEQTMHLIYAAYVYVLDKSVGNIIDKVAELNLSNDTIFFFMSDNGATTEGVNLPYKGIKHTLWEGGTRVPAALLWPGKFDSMGSNVNYSQQNNKYDGFISYLDFYPTIMSMTRQPLLVTTFDGIDAWKHLQDRTELRPDELNDVLYMMWSGYGALKTRRWKLFYARSTGRLELYDLKADVGESVNVASTNRDVADHLIGLYEDWITSHSYAVSFLPVDRSDIPFPDPSPKYGVIEVKATQTGSILTDDQTVYVRYHDIDGWDYTTNFLDTGDRLEYDIFVFSDSAITQGCFISADNVEGKPFFTHKEGLNQDGLTLPDVNLPKGKWSHQVLGVGDLSPHVLTRTYISFTSKKPGYYHYALDNIMVRDKKGRVKHMIWDSKNDFITPLRYRYRGKEYTKFKDVQEVAGFPFSSMEITSTDVMSTEQCAKQCKHDRDCPCATHKNCDWRIDGGTCNQYIAEGEKSRTKLICRRNLGGVRRCSTD